MNKTTILLLLCLSPIIIYAQNDTIQQRMPKPVVDLSKFLGDNISYPQDAMDQLIAGRVKVSFTVEKDGSITEVKILNGVYPTLDSEALRVVRLMPKWTPGIYKGKPVPVKFNLPIVFELPANANAQALTVRYNPPFHGMRYYNVEGKPGALESLTITKDNVAIIRGYSEPGAQGDSSIYYRGPYKSIVTLYDGRTTYRIQDSTISKIDKSGYTTIGCPYENEPCISKFFTHLPKY